LALLETLEGEFLGKNAGTGPITGWAETGAGDA